MNYYDLLRPLLFHLPPETAHHVTLKSLKIAEKIGLVRASQKSSHPRKVMGIEFPNPIGLAAGLDKNGEYIDALAALGFGFIEVGTVTPRPQMGNPKPRLFRIPKYQALINRMGFNNRGVDFLVTQLQKKKFTGILGINIGKQKETPNENAIDDYTLCMHKVYEYAKYIVVNISSPNTPGLRELQFGDELARLMHGLKEEQSILAMTHHRYVPLVIKIAPDLAEAELAAMAKIFLQEEIDGVIATNTTLDHSKIAGEKYADEMGGLSGQPLFSQSTKILKQLHHHLENKIPLIASGGVMNAQDAAEKFSAGASLVQIYTGLIYRGPGLIAELRANAF